MSKIKFFNFDEECEQLGINTDVGAGCLAITTDRGTGKTTSCYKSRINKCLESNRMFVLCRTTAGELDAVRNFINLNYNNLKCFDMLVWEVEEYEEDGETKYEKVRVVGFLVNLTSASKFKSAFENDGVNIDIGYVIYDEYNEVKIRKDIYEEFTNILATIKRNNPNFWVIMLGNKDNQNNPFLLDWGIRFKDALTEKLIIDLRDKYGVLYVEYPANSFSGINTTDNFIAKFASANPEMNRFMNQGGFRKTSLSNIIKYEMWIEPYITKKLYNCVIRKKCYEIGVFNDEFLEKEKCLYIREVEFNHRDKTLKTFSFGSQNQIGQGVYNLEEEDIADIVNLMNFYKLNDKLYFNSFGGFIDVSQEIYMVCKYNKFIED